MTLRSWIIVAVAASACGGRSEEPVRDAAAGSGGVGGGGGGASGSSGSAGGSPMCTGFMPGCLLSCASMSPFQARCVDGEWRCEGGVFYDACPPESCSKDEGECCHPTTGNISGADCGEDGRRLPCNEPGANRIPNNAACIPDRLDVTNCNDLDGTACDEAGLQCNNAGGCRLSCRCIGGDGGLVWSCILPVC